MDEWQDFWNANYDLCLALFLIFNALTRWQVGIFGVLADYSKLKYIYLVEGGLFVLIATPFAFHFGIGGLLLSSLLIHVFLTYFFSFYYFRKSFPGLHTFRLAFFLSLSLIFLFFCNFFIPFFCANIIIIYVVKIICFLFYVGIILRFVLSSFLRQSALNFLGSFRSLF